MVQPAAFRDEVAESWLGSRVVRTQAGTLIEDAGVSVAPRRHNPAPTALSTPHGYQEEETGPGTPQGLWQECSHTWEEEASWLDLVNPSARALMGLPSEQGAPRSW